MPPKSSSKNKNNGPETGDIVIPGDTPPKDISMTDLWTLMMSIKKDTEATNQKLNHMEKRVNAVEETNKVFEGKVMDIQSNVESLQTSVDILTGRLIRNETKNVRLQNELSELKSQSMKNNLIFTFDEKSDHGKEQHDENSSDIVRSFLGKVMKVSSPNKLTINAAHRLGPPVGGKGRRPIIARFPFASDVDAIMAKVGELKGSRHFVNRQIPPEKRERKQFAMREFSEKRKNKDIKVRMVNENLFINGTLQRKFLPPSLPSGFDETDDTEELDIHESDTIEDSGSTFKGYVNDVTSLEDVRATLDALVARPDVSAASHVIYAFRFHQDDDTDKPLMENFDSDGDHGVGLKLLRAMQEKNVVGKLFVVTRSCATDYAHIGKRRFQHAIEACFSVLGD